MTGLLLKFEKIKAKKLQNFSKNATKKLKIVKQATKKLQFSISKEIYTNFFII